VAKTFIEKVLRISNSISCACYIFLPLSRDPVLRITNLPLSISCVTYLYKNKQKGRKTNSNNIMKGKTCFGAAGAVLCWVGLAVPCWDSRYDRSALQARNTKKVTAGTRNIIKLSW